MKRDIETEARAPFGWIGAVAGALAIAVVASKGWLNFIQEWAAYFWWLSYGDGLVRRGLAGQLFQLVFGVLDRKALYAPLMGLTALWITTLGLALVVPFGRVLPRLFGRDRAIFVMLCSGLFISQLWPMLTFTAGYLDSLLLVLATAAALCLRRGWTWPAAVIAAAGPFVHEFFVFLVPFVLASALPEPGNVSEGAEVQPLGDWMAAEQERKPWWPLAAVAVASVAATALSILMSRRGAAEAQFHAMPLSAELKATILSTSMNQSLGEALQRMFEKISAEPGFAFANVIFFVGPALLASAGLLSWRRPGGSAPLLQAAAGLLPAAAILVAWDLSRFLVITTYTAGALFLWTAERRTDPGGIGDTAVPPTRAKTPAPLQAALGAVLILATAYALYPFTYTYFGYRSLFQYFPPQGLRDDLYRSAWAPLIESPWGHQDDPFTDQDVTCRLLPAGEADRGCVHPIKTGDWIFGPYLSLPTGRYRVSVTIAAPAGCSAPLAFRVDSLRVRDAPVAMTEVHAGPLVQTALEFPVGIDLAGRSDFEFRTTQISGITCGAELRKMVVRRLGP